MSAQPPFAVPIIDATAQGFDVNTRFSDLRKYRSYESDPPEGSLCVVFYTIVDEGTHLKINFHIQALAVLVEGEGAGDDF